MNISGVECYEKDGTVYLNLETVARGLGFTQTQNKGGVEYTSVRWERVEQYLAEIGFPHKWGKDGYIPENIFYRLAMKAKNETAEKFQAFIADEVIPTIRRTGGYVANDELFINTYLPGADDSTKQLFRGLLANSRESAKKVSYFNALVDRGNNLSFRDTAKELNLKERSMINMLIERGYLYRDQKRQLRPYAETNNGYFTLKEYINGDKTGVQTLVTVEGRKKIASLYGRET